MDYLDYKYLFPPRPETKIAKTMLGFYQKRGWHAQKKKNGTCTLIFARGDRVIFKTRHNEDHKLWTPQDDHYNFFEGSDGWNVFVAELLHSKVAGGPKHELYIFDQLVKNGNSLIGTKFGDRITDLHETYGGRNEGDQTRIAPRICIANSINSGFVQTFEHLAKEDEGLVLKDPNALLKPCLKPDSNKSWSVKCRIAHSNYSF
jgi:hypothetical protein